MLPLCPKTPRGVVLQTPGFLPFLIQFISLFLCPLASQEEGKSKQKYHVPHTVGPLCVSYLPKLSCG